MAVSGAKERIDAALQGWFGITSQPHRFGGTEYCLGRREIGHVHGDSLVDIPFPKKVRNELVSVGRAEPHNILPDSGWVSIYLRQASDVDRAIELLRVSFEIANQRTAR
jgi:luciferase-like monooxygenase